MEIQREILYLHEQSIRIYLSRPQNPKGHAKLASQRARREDSDLRRDEGREKLRRPPTRPLSARSFRGRRNFSPSLVGQWPRERRVRKAHIWRPPLDSSIMTCGVLAVITFCSGIALGASYDFDRAVLSTTTEDIDEDYPTNLQVKVHFAPPCITEIFACMVARGWIFSTG